MKEDADGEVSVIRGFEHSYTQPLGTRLRAHRVLIKYGVILLTELSNLTRLVNITKVRFPRPNSIKPEPDSYQLTELPH